MMYNIILSILFSKNQLSIIMTLKQHNCSDPHSYKSKSIENRLER